jgi:hypothetical protein
MHLLNTILHSVFPVQVVVEMNNSKCMPKIIRKELNVSTCLAITKITTKQFLICKTCMDNCTHAIIFGENWFSAECKPSRQLVWPKGDACLIPFIISRLFVSAACIFAYAMESEFKNVQSLFCTIETERNY